MHLARSETTPPPQHESTGPSRPGLHAAGEDCPEATDDETLCVVADERGPALRWTAWPWTAPAVAWHVFPHGPWRYAQPQFEQQLIGNALLAPGHILPGHAADQCL